MRTPAPLHFARLAALLLAATAASGQTTYRWIDPKTGGTVISDLPPPAGARQVVRYTTGTVSGDEQPLPYALRQASEKFPVVLYTSSGCNTCKHARALLEQRGVPFSEKVLTTEEDLAELGRQLGGEVLLPSIGVGRQSSKGFTPTAWNELLDAAGYPATAAYRAKPSGGGK